MKDTASLIIGIINAFFSPMAVARNVVILITIKYEGTLPLDFLPTIFWPHYRLQKWYRFDYATNSKAMYSTGKLLTTNDTKMDCIALTKKIYTCSSLFDIVTVETGDHSHVHTERWLHIAFQYIHHSSAKLVCFRFHIFYSLIYSYTLA